MAPRRVTLPFVLLLASAPARHVRGAGYGEQPRFMPLDPTLVPPIPSPKPGDGAPAAATTFPIAPPPHHGLYLQLRAGGGYTFVTGDIHDGLAPGQHVRIQCESISAALAVGGALSRKVALFGLAVGSSGVASNSRSRFEGRPRSWGAGIGLSTYVESWNAEVTGAIVATRLTAINAGSNFGPGFQGLIAKRGRLSQRMSAGIGFEAFVATMSIDAPAQAQAYLSRWTEVVTSLVVIGAYD